MATKGTGTYQVTGWDEQPYDEQDGVAKTTVASIDNTFTGVIEGSGHSRTIMVYPSEASANFVGLQRVTGSIGGRKGSFVLQASGDWVGGTARAQWSVVPDSGTGELEGLTGTGGYVSGENGACDYTLDYDFG